MDWAGKNFRPRVAKTDVGRGYGQPVIDSGEVRARVAWRVERLLSAGFERELAARIAADRGFDLHALLELVDRGCPPALAWRITAPLEREP